MFTHSRMYFSLWEMAFVWHGQAHGRNSIADWWGKQDVNFIDEVLSGNAMANYSAPAQGLHLVKVWLEPDPFLESVKANERDFS